MHSLVAIKTQNNDFQVEYEILSPIDISAVTDSNQRDIFLVLQDVEKQLDLCEKEISKLSTDIDNFTNHSDRIDYAIAIISGIVSGLIDSFFVGELNLKECHEFGKNKIEDTVKKRGKDSDLQKAIKNLEEKTKKFFPSDANLNDFGGGKQHHLRDFAHHPTLIGLVCSLLTQFTEMCYGTDTAGVFISVPVKDKSRIGDTVPQKIVYGTLYWYLHLVSDMAGSSQYAGKGTGLPGPLLSLAKVLSALPFFKKINNKGHKEISVFISKLFNGTLFAKKDSSGKIIQETVVPIDLRTEIGILKEQAFPVIVNECIVRTFYSIRRFGMELKDHEIVDFEDLKSLNWKKNLPIGNRTVERMLTIASGTLAVVDIADAAIRSGGLNAACLLRVNYVGIGRFAIAIGVDAGMGIKRGQLVNERIKAMGKELELLNAKVYYRCAQLHYAEADMLEAEEHMWIAAQDAERTINIAYEMAQDSVELMAESLSEIRRSMENISSYRAAIEEKNPGLIKEIVNTLKY